MISLLIIIIVVPVLMAEIVIGFITAGQYRNCEEWKEAFNRDIHTVKFSFQRRNIIGKIYVGFGYFLLLCCEIGFLLGGFFLYFIRGFGKTCKKINKAMMKKEYR